MTDAPLSWSRFALAGGGLYYMIRSSDETYAIHFVDLKTKVDRVVASVRTPPSLGFSVAPNNKWALYTASERQSQDLMLVENFR